jgi:hypothetical protein
MDHVSFFINLKIFVMKKTIAIIAISAFFLLSCNNSTNEALPEKAPEVTPAIAVLDSTASAELERSIQAFAKGDVNGFTANMDDNIRFYYPGAGDSLMGRNAVNTYYTDRWKLIDSIRIVNPVYLSVNVNRGPVTPGKWLMAWYSFRINYKSGNGVFLPIHTVAHTNAAGKTDILYMYYDMHKVMMAQRK